jgi:hypothetical protein
MNPLRWILERIGTDTFEHTVNLGPDKERQRERLEASLREGARVLSTQSPPGMRGRIMDQVRRASVTEPATPQAFAAPFYRRPRQIAILCTLAAAVVALLYPRAEPHSEMPPSPNIVGIHREVFDWITPVFQMPATFDGELEAEIHNVWLDGSRAAKKIVSILPSTLRAPFDRP